jgi:hypothetical protein
MSDTNKKSLSYKLQKNPFLLVFIIVVFAIIIFAIANISSAIQKNNKTESETTTVTSAETQEETETTETEVDASSTLSNLKKYSTDIENITVEKEEKRVAVKVEYKDKASLLKTHEATDINSAQVVPVFCFYLKNGEMLKCPGELRLLEDGKTAVYYLTVIDDYANAVALTDEVTVDYNNILDNKFNLYLQNKTNNTGKTIFGTYGELVEGDLSGIETNNGVSNVAQGIKNVEITKTSQFIWVDIYYNDVNSYTELNNDFITNFVRFGFENNGVTYKRDFITTEYDNLNMVRCKFDSYSLKGLADEMGVGEITVDQLFSNYSIYVWTSDYDTDTDLFSING